MREKFELVLARYAEGGTLKTAMREARTNPAAFYAFLAANPSDKTRYYTVQEARADMMFDECYELSTDAEIDPRRMRAAADIRMKIGAAYHRERFGERVDVNVSGQVDMVAALAEAKARILRPLCDPAQIVDAEYTAIPAPNAFEASDMQSDARGEPGAVGEFPAPDIFAE